MHNVVVKRLAVNSRCFHEIIARGFTFSRTYYRTDIYWTATSFGALNRRGMENLRLSIVVLLYLVRDGDKITSNH